MSVFRLLVVFSILATATIAIDKTIASDVYQKIIKSQGVAKSKKEALQKAIKNWEAQVRFINRTKFRGKPLRDKWWESKERQILCLRRKKSQDYKCFLRSKAVCPGPPGCG